MYRVIKNSDLDYRLQQKKSLFLISYWKTIYSHFIRDFCFDEMKRLEDVELEIEVHNQAHNSY